MEKHERQIHSLQNKNKAHIFHLTRVYEKHEPHIMNDSFTR